MPKFLTHAQARDMGYTIDDVAAGRPCAYKGPRFNPVLPVLPVFTELEERLMLLLDDALMFIEGFEGDEAQDEPVEELCEQIRKVLDT